MWITMPYSRVRKNPTSNPLPAIREGAFDVPHVIRKRYM
jgi:hypothetical protein